MKGYKRVASVEEFLSSPIIEVSGEGLDRVDICIAKVDGRYYALSNVCSHKGAPMSTGTVRAKHIVCPWHKAYFTLEDGTNFFPAERPLRSFETKVEGDSIYLKIPEKPE